MLLYQLCVPISFPTVLSSFLTQIWCVDICTHQAACHRHGWHEAVKWGRSQVTNLLTGQLERTNLLSERTIPDRMGMQQGDELSRDPKVGVCYPAGRHGSVCVDWFIRVKVKFGCIRLPAVTTELLFCLLCSLWLKQLDNILLQN